MTSTIAWAEEDHPAVELADIEWEWEQPKAISFPKWVSVLASWPYVELLQTC